MRSAFFALLLLWSPDAGAMTIERVTSPAAIDAWLVEDHALPLVALRFAFPGGAALDPTGKSGLAAMAVSLLDEGAGPYDTTAFKTRLDDLVIGMRFEAGRDEIVGSLRTLKANLGQAVELLRLTLTAPRFEASAIERVRGEFVASLSQEAQNPRALSGRLWMRDAFEDHPYGGNVYGTAESIAAITRDDLSGFVAARLHRAGLVIGAVGDVTRNELTASGLRVLAGKVPDRPVDVVLDGDGRILRGKCTCSHHHQYGLRRGPCRHLQALRRAALGERPRTTLDRWFEQLWN